MGEKMAKIHEEYRRAVAAVSDPEVWRQWRREADLADLPKEDGGKVITGLTFNTQ